MFVSKARYADREREVLELRRELRELKDQHERVLDEINFRSTGFHLYSRFDIPREQPVVAAAPQPSVDVPNSPIADAINNVGRRPSAITSYMENSSVNRYQAAEREAAEQLPSIEIQKQLDRALAAADKRASSSGQA